MNAAITHSSVVLPGERVVCLRPDLTGISQLRYASQNQQTSDLAAAAIRCLKTEASDTLIVATTSADVPSPATANRTLAKLRWPASVWGFDVTSSCTSFLSAVLAAKGLLEGTQKKRVCVVAAELKHRQIRDDDLRLKSLFADGAGALVLQSAASQQSFDLTYSKVRHDLVDNIGVDFDMGKPILHLLEPKRLYREILREMSEAILSCWDLRAHKIRSLGLNPLDVDGLVYVHQANATLLQDLRERLPYEIGSRVPILMSDIGNTVSASLPIARTRSLMLLAREAGKSIEREVCGEDFCYVTLWRGERLSVLDVGAAKLRRSWMDELQPNEISFFKKASPCRSSSLYNCDLWVCSGGGFQTLGVLHHSVEDNLNNII